MAADDPPDHDKPSSCDGRNPDQGNPFPARHALVIEEGFDICGEFGVVLEKESVCRVGVDLDLSLRDEACEQIGVVRQDHWVAVTVGNEDGHLDRAHSLQE
jgi:hypothetical protein